MPHILPVLDVMRRRLRQVTATVKLTVRKRTFPPHVGLSFYTLHGSW